MGERQIYYSLVSGRIYEIPLNEPQPDNKYEIPVTGYPKSSCNKCMGRGFVGRHKDLKYYEICPCLRKKIDFDKIKTNERLNNETD
jgi:hypothetical protein